MKDRLNSPNYLESPTPELAGNHKTHEEKKSDLHLEKEKSNNYRMTSMSAVGNLIVKKEDYNKPINQNQDNSTNMNLLMNNNGNQTKVMNNHNQGT